MANEQDSAANLGSRSGRAAASVEMTQSSQTLQPILSEMLTNAPYVDCCQGAKAGVFAGRLYAALVLAVLMLAASTTGCAMHQTLQRNTVTANLTVADIYHQQVLNNVARF